jgi:glucose/arabinose dehydrogenase
MLRQSQVFALAAVVLLALATADAPAGQSVLAAGPPVPLNGFQDTLVASIPAPTALAFAPDGRVLIASQSGQLRVIQDGALLATPALDLASSGRICANHERGLLGVAADPAFAQNGYIYLYYTFNKYPLASCPDVQPSNPQNPVNRVACFTLGQDNRADLASEQILIDNIPSTNGNHNAGDLHFGAAGQPVDGRRQRALLRPGAGRQHRRA